MFLLSFFSISKFPSHQNGYISFFQYSQVPESPNWLVFQYFQVCSHLDRLTNHISYFSYSTFLKPNSIPSLLNTNDRSGGFPNGIFGSCACCSKDLSRSGELLGRRRRCHLEIQTRKVQVQKSKAQRYKFRHPKSKFRHSKYSCISSDTHSISSDTHSISSDTQSIIQTSTV